MLFCKAVSIKKLAYNHWTAQHIFPVTSFEDAYWLRTQEYILLRTWTQIFGQNPQTDKDSYFEDPHISAQEL